MGRGKSKIRRLIVSTNDTEDVIVGEDDKVGAQKRRGRPLKQVIKDDDESDNDGEEEMKVHTNDDNMEESDNNKLLIGDYNDHHNINDSMKRKRSFESKEMNKVVKEKSDNNGSITIKFESESESQSKSQGFRQAGSRRKSKPHRAAEAGFHC